MIHVANPVYPELRQLFGAYLNADFTAQYGSVANALTAYRHETGAGHRAAALVELDRLTAAPGAAIRLAADLTGLGCEVALATPGEAWSLAATIRRALDGG
jgi:CdiI immunity protein